MDFCGKSMLPVGRESLPVSVPIVPNAPEPCGVGRIEGGPCRLSAPESWIFFQISSDVLPLPLEVVGFALPRRARLRGDDAAATEVVAAPPAAGGLNISANCSTLKLLVGPTALPSNWFTKSSFIESWPEGPPRDAPRVGIVRVPPSRSRALRAFGKPRAVSLRGECVRARGECGSGLIPASEGGACQFSPSLTCWGHAASALIDRGSCGVKERVHRDVDRFFMG